MNRPLQVLADNLGTVVAGFLSANVYYIRFIDHVSTGLGIRSGSHLRRELADATEVTCFFDVASAERVDFAARSAIIRALLVNRRRLVKVTTLTTPGLNATKVRSLLAVLGNISLVIDSAAVFQAEMLEAAPFAQGKLLPNRWVPIARSIRPAARSLRPRARTGSHG
jgi:hypothetical protein